MPGMAPDSTFNRLVLKQKKIRDLLLLSYSAPLFSSPTYGGGGGNLSIDDGPGRGSSPAGGMGLEKPPSAMAASLGLASAAGIGGSLVLTSDMWLPRARSRSS